MKKESIDITPQNKKRRLAAIMFADIVGYTAMMQKDEDKTAQILHKFHECLKEQVPQHNGQVINFFGDGCLSIFDSSVDAVNCSIVIQKICNTDLHIPLRIGLHSGDIFIQADNAFGDSVNITSRIESMGVPGSILLSQKLQGEVKNHREFQLVSLGKFDFKNVDDLLEVFAVANEGVIVPKSSELKGKFKEKNIKSSHYSYIKIAGFIIGAATFLFLGKHFLSSNALSKNSETKQIAAAITKSIAVMPFDNENGGVEKDYITGGFADELRGALSKFDELKVISRSSSVFYKKQSLPLVEIGQKLGVTHLITGKVQWEGNLLNIVIELNNALKDEIEWSSPYHITMQELPYLKQKITESITKELALQLTDAQQKSLTDNPQVLSDVYDKWLKARHSLEDYTPEKMQLAYQLCEEIIVEDSTYASAYYILGYTHLINAVWFGSANPKADMEKSKVLFEKGLKFDPKNALCHSGLSNYFLFYEWDFEKAEENIQKAIEYGDPRSHLSAILMKFYNGEFDAAEKRLAKHKEVDPLSVYHDFYQGRIWFFQGKTEQAKKVLRDGIRSYGLTDYYHSLGKVYFNTGDFQLAMSTLEKGLQAIGKNHPPLMADLALSYSKLGEKEETNKVLKTLEKMYAEGESGSPAFYLAQIYSGLQEKEKAFEWLNKSFEKRETEMVWLKIEPQFDFIRSDSRYTELLNKVGFPKVLVN